MGADDGLPQLPFATPAGWERWLEDHHASGEPRAPAAYGELAGK